ncbi:hypothetical protein [Chryseobacterium sp. SIMBA_029]|uniref:hypothetical protein n=1 Tax=Chryseobacterium sp. SIMBA_029 TaxID=3085772 RepID=UPI00397B1B6F
MKNIIYLSSGILAITLMSFSSNKSNNTEIIEVLGKTVHVKNTQAVKAADLAFLSQNLVGWSVCDYQAVSNECTSRYSNFPDDVNIATKIKVIIAKYQ